MSGVQARLAELGLTLPKVSPPLADYVPAVQSGRHVYVSGQLPMVDGTLVATGKVGAEVGADQAKELAKRCALNALAAIDALVGLDRVTRVVKLTGFVVSGAIASLRMVATTTGTATTITNVKTGERNGSHSPGRSAAPVSSAINRCVPCSCANTRWTSSTVITIGM